MNLRLRTAVMSAVAIVTAGLLNVTAASPARAAEGETCMDPIITGTIERVVTQNNYGLSTVWAEFNQTGHVDATCPTNFTDYRYKVTFTYDGRTVSSYHSDLVPVYDYRPGVGLVRTGTDITFPTLRLSWDGYRNVNLAVTSGSKSKFSSTWCRSNEETYDSSIPAIVWANGGYDTRTGTPRARVIACP